LKFIFSDKFCFAEFKDAKPLLISEVAILLEHKQKQADNTVFKEYAVLFSLSQNLFF
jgi:hypothetical protein